MTALSPQYQNSIYAVILLLGILAIYCVYTLLFGPVGGSKDLSLNSDNDALLFLTFWASTITMGILNLHLFSHQEDEGLDGNTSNSTVPKEHLAGFVSGDKRPVPLGCPILLPQISCVQVLCCPADTDNNTVYNDNSYNDGKIYYDDFEGGLTWAGSDHEIAIQRIDNYTFIQNDDLNFFQTYHLVY